MEYISRLLEKPLDHHLQRGKSILLLGPRQTGKTTLLSRRKVDLNLSFITPSLRQRYETHLSLLTGEIESLAKRSSKKPLVVLDEVQKIPAIMDVVQDLIDRKVAQFILTGSSARKLRRHSSLNLLPGRVVSLRLDPFTYQEYPETSLENLLLYGSLPPITEDQNLDDREADLQSYVENYLEEEVRSEALVKDLGHFSRFLEYAGLESGNIVSFRALSQEIGVAHTTISSYFEILEDCLIAERVDPLTKSKTRKKLIKSSRYLLFDLGVRRFCAKEGNKLTPERWGYLFEQYVGLELIRYSRFSKKNSRILFWKDPDGPEVDWIFDQGSEYIPIEVKWTEKPSLSDIRHLEVFLSEYKSPRGYLICRIPRRIKLSSKVEAIPWQELQAVLSEN